MPEVTMEMKEFVEMVVEKTVTRAIDQFKKDSQCVIHEKKLIEITQTLQGDNGNGLIERVDKIMPKLDKLWIKVAIAIFVGVGLNQGVRILGLLP